MHMTGRNLGIYELLQGADGMPVTPRNISELPNEVLERIFDAQRNSTMAVLGNGASNMVYQFRNAGIEATAVDPVYDAFNNQPQLITQMQQKMYESHTELMKLVRLFYSQWLKNPQIATKMSDLDYISHQFAEYFMQTESAGQAGQHLSLHLSGGALPALPAHIKDALKSHVDVRQESFDQWLHDFRSHPKYYLPASSTNLPFQGGSLDYVLAWSFLYPHALQPGCETLLHNSLQEITRVLRPNGVFILGPLDARLSVVPIVNMLQEMVCDFHGDHSEDVSGLMLQVSGTQNSSPPQGAATSPPWPYPPS